MAQYMYNKFMTLGVDGYLSLWPDFDILDRETRFRFDMVIVISKSGNSGSALSWSEAVKRNRILLAAFCGDGDSPLAQQADMTFCLRTGKNTITISTIPIRFSATVCWDSRM
ncbi:SIS domain-containing protein [Serratia ureilytica]